MPPAFEMHMTPSDDEDHPEVHLSFEVIDSVPECVGVAVTRAPGGRTVRRSDLREIALETLLEQASVSVAMAIKETRADGTTVAVMTIDPLILDSTLSIVRSKRRSAARPGPTDEQLQAVARLYEATDTAPTRAVAEHYKIAHRTATLWVKKAREAGYLPATTQGKASR